MWFAYFLALIPAIAGGVLWIKSEKIVWQEWAISTVTSLVTVAIFHFVSIHGMTGDSETWSGKITEATFHPQWVEEYTVDIYKTVKDKKGHEEKVFDHTETRYRTHSEHWNCYTSLDNEYSIEQATFEEISKNFNCKETRDGHKSGFYSGDPHIYVATNKTGYLYPVTTWRTFENRVKAAPSLFSYSEVPATVPVFPYPANSNFMTSDRLIGQARRDVSILEWDRMNARLGPFKKVNVILIGFSDADSSIAHDQEAKWIGGKKNDLVLCYGTGWSYVFGWTERDLVKANLQTILLKGPIDTTIIPKIEKEVTDNYKIKDWSKFDYITIEPPTWAYWVLLLVMVLTQGGFWAWALLNPDIHKDAYVRKFRMPW